MGARIKRHELPRCASEVSTNDRQTASDFVPIGLLTYLISKAYVAQPEPEQDSDIITQSIQSSF